MNRKAFAIECNVLGSEMRRSVEGGIEDTNDLSGDPWFVYLLRCVDGSLYTRVTNDVIRRCRQHNKGTASRYTRSRRPTRLVHQERQPSRSLALKREAAIKRMSKRAKELLVRLGRSRNPGS
jgi:putative endonuclease